MDNFSWSAKEEDIPLDSFSENYYEPGLLSNVMQNQDYLNSNPNMVKSGITLPPKVVLQIAEQQQRQHTGLAVGCFMMRAAALTRFMFIKMEASQQ